MGDDKRWLAPLSGLLFLALMIASFALVGEPPSVEDDSAQEIVDHYSDNKDDVMFGAAIGGLASVALLFFGGYLRKVLSDAEGDRGFLSAVSFAGVIVIATGAAIDNTINFALAEAADDIDPTGAQTLQALWDNDFIPFSVGLFTFLMATGISIVRHGALPKWMGWVAIVASLTAISPAFPVAGIAAILLIAISSVMLARRERAGSAPAA